MTSRTELMKERLYQKLIAKVSQETISNSYYGALPVALEIFDDHNQYQIAFLPSGKFSKWQIPIDTILLKQEIQKSVEEYIERNNIRANYTSVRDALTDIFCTMLEKGVVIIDTSKNYE